MNKLGIAVVGTGFIGPVHVEAVRRNPELAELRAIVGITDEEAKAAAKKLNIPYYTSEYKDVLKRDDVDVVHVCTPNYLHYPMVKECLLSGKNVLCEKPLSLTYKEATELAKLASDMNLIGAVNYNLRYYPMVQEIKALNQENAVGDIFAIQGSYLQDWLLCESDYSWRLESKLSGKSRAVADIGTHWLDMVQYVTGQKIAKVYARFGRMYDQRKKSKSGDDLTFEKSNKKDTSDYISYDVDTEDYAQIMFEMSNGVIGNLTVSQVSAGFKNYMELREFGKKSSLDWNSESPNQIKIGNRDRANEILMKDPSLLHERPSTMSAFPGGHQEGYGDTLKYMLRDFYSSILSDDSNQIKIEYPTLQDGAAEMCLCEAIIKSVKEDTWVDL